jgi:hypothetical protein
MSLGKPYYQGAFSTTQWSFLFHSYKKRKIILSRLLLVKIYSNCNRQ